MNQTNASKSMEKLSSGFRINRAGDDAAGLAISEKMRGQIRGLKQAQRNAQDGISLIQTAEGALNETHAILQRMRELATQSATDTNTETDRGEIQKEINQLAAEITRIAETTQFNTMDLLNGDFEAKFHIGANAAQNVELSIAAMDSKAYGVQGTAYEATDVYPGLQVRSTTGEALTIKFTAALTGPGHAAVPETKAELNEAGTEITITLKQDAGSETDAGSITATHAEVKAALESIAGEAGLLVEVDADSFEAAAIATVENDIEVNVTNVDEEASKKVGINVSTQELADQAITTINKALEDVSSERSKLGAMQNRLEHTIANLGTSAENLQAAESRIRDLDMAEEIMAFTKNNILQQAATAMLAQANMAPQSVLQLLG